MIVFFHIFFFLLDSFKLCLEHISSTPERRRAINIMDILNVHLPLLMRTYIRTELEAHFLSLPTTAEGMLADSSGNPLRFDPDNEPPSPLGNGVPYCFKALPHHSDRKNTPTIVNNTDELARTYCQEFWKTKTFTIATADSSSLLNILSRASCFSGEVQKKAAGVREVRNQWAHHDYTVWTQTEYKDALDTIMELVSELPDNQCAATEIKRQS